MEQQAKLAHRAIDVVCGLYFAVDKDLSHLPEKRTDAAFHIVRSPVRIPDTVHPGYGELTYPALQQLFNYLCDEAPEHVHLHTRSSFLDVGSGFGKAVVHAAIRGRVQCSMGIEYVSFRHQQANITIQHLRAGRVPGLRDTRGVLPSLSLDAVQLVEGDVTEVQYLHVLHEATHIYCFDVLFGPQLMRMLVEQLMQTTRCVVFLSYHNPHQLSMLGLMHWSCIHRVAGRTTGKQRFTCHVYVKCQQPTFLSSSPSSMSSVALEQRQQQSTSLASASSSSPSSPSPSSSHVPCSTDAVVPDDDHLMTTCVLCGKKCSPSAIGGRKRVFVTQQWKRRMGERARIVWRRESHTVIHDGCRYKVTRMSRAKTDI